MAACAAGAANSVVIENYGSAAGHALAAALVIFLAGTSTKEEDTEEPDIESSVLERISGVLGWTVAAVGSCYILGEQSWPYALSRKQMLGVFIPFLFAGAVVRTRCRC